jgi:hypothetical protein
MSQLTLTELLRRRVEICNSMNAITSMRRGTLNEIYHTQKLKDGTTVQRGPFYNITQRCKGKTLTTSVPKKELEKIREESDNYKRFRSLSEEYVSVCEQIALLEENEDDVKKN